MPIKILQPNDRKLIKTPAKYLNVIKATGVFTIDSPSFDLMPLSLKQGHQAVLDEITQVYLVNESQGVIEIEYENANIRVFGGGSEAVEIIGNVTVDSILNGVTVDASIGDVAILQPNNYVESEDIVVAAGAKVQLLTADENRIETEIFLHGADFVTCRYGSSAITSTKGRLLSGGGENVVGSATIKGTAGLYIINPSDKAITVSVGVETRE